MGDTQTDAVTVRRKDIILVEEIEYIVDLANFHEGKESTVPYTSWRAVLNGRLSTSEEVAMERQGQHANEALQRLQEAIEAEGWVIS